MSESAKKLYATKLLDPRWQKKRLEIFKRDGFSCWWCGDKEKTLHIHHEQYIGENPWETPEHFLITLCDECHEIDHFQYTELEKILVSTIRNRDMRNFEKIKLLNRVIKTSRGLI